MKIKRAQRRFNKTAPDNKKIIISSEYYKNEKPVYLCSFCSQSLSRLTDAGLNNSTYWCRSCSIEWDPESENLRKESKISVPDRNIEPAPVSLQYTMDKDVEIRHTPPIRGGFKELQDRGIRIKDYHTTEKE